MEKKKKINILTDLIARANSIEYSNRREMIPCEDDAKAFVRNTIGEKSGWITRIEQISWLILPTLRSKPSEGELKDAWQSGKGDFVGVLKSIKSEVELYSNDSVSSSSDRENPKSKKVFIVHGKNDVMKLSVARFLEQLDLIPIILHEQPNIGRTIIEKFERLSSDISFAIVLLSADDKMKNGEYRARQNVILELGYFLARLGRENVVVLYDDSIQIELPSDVSGILYEAYDKPDGAWRVEVIKELKEAGFDVDANSLT